MNFDNPVYRKTTDDELFLSNGGHSYEHNPGKASKYQPVSSKFLHTILGKMQTLYPFYFQHRK